MAMIESEMIAFFKIRTVSKYSRVAKNNSKTEASLIFISAFALVELLNEIRTVNSVRINPAIVNETVETSDTIENRYSSFGITT